MATNNTDEKIMYKDLSYKLQGLAFKIRNELGSGHKESIYQKALENELKNIGINFKREPSIKIYSLKGDFLGLYRPDFLIDDKIIIELKAAQFVTRQENARVYDYLRNSEYELAYLINFASPRLFIKRLIFTNDRKPQMPTNIKRIVTNVALFVAIGVLFVGIRGVGAARIFFEPATNTHEVGESFTANVILDTQGEDINALDLEILYPPLLEVKSISKNGSAINLWVAEPSFTSKGVFLSGGSPGGIKSSDALIAKITMKAKAIGEGSFQLAPSSAVLLNDGLGTQAKLTFGQGLFNISAQPKKEPTPPPAGGTKPDESVKPSPSSTASPEISPKEEGPKDRTKPKKFQIFLGQDPRVFDGKYFASFFTTDSKSGVDHYELKEGDGEYKVARSPYLLSDQGLRSVIRVRAYDGAGNYREVVYQGLLKRLWLWILRLL